MKLAATHVLDPNALRGNDLLAKIREIGKWLMKQRKQYEQVHSWPAAKYAIRALLAVFQEPPAYGIAGVASKLPPSARCRLMRLASRALLSRTTLFRVVSSSPWRMSSDSRS